MFRRLLTQKVLESARFSSVVLINGAWQTGKSTFIDLFFARENGYEFVTLDDLNLLRLAKENPVLFLEQLPSKAAIDEVQRVPDMFIALKRIVDENRHSRQFILSGSASILTLPRLSESLAGRMEVHTLWPLSQREIRNLPGSFIDAVFEEGFPGVDCDLSMDEVVDCIIKGGYPEALLQMNAGRGPEWFNSYLMTILQRDIRELSNIEGLSEMPNLLTLIASRAGNLINFSDLGRSMKLNSMTIKRYYTLLKTVFLVVELPAWASNRGKSLTKSPKVFLNDTGMLSYLKGINPDTLKRDHGILGAALENFVVMELMKQAGWSKTHCRISHFRSHDNTEVDCVLEANDGRIVGIEVKASADVGTEDFGGLRALRTLVGERFACGVVIYTGKRALRYDKDLVAVGLGAMWAS